MPFVARIPMLVQQLLVAYDHWLEPNDGDDAWGRWCKELAFHVTLSASSYVNPGGTADAGRRVAWSAVYSMPADKVDLRTARCKALAAMGVIGVVHGPTTPASVQSTFTAIRDYTVPKISWQLYVGMHENDLWPPEAYLGREIREVRKELDRYFEKEASEERLAALALQRAVAMRDAKFAQIELDDDEN